MSITSTGVKENFPTKRYFPQMLFKSSFVLLVSSACVMSMNTYNWFYAREGHFLKHDVLDSNEDGQLLVTCYALYNNPSIDPVCPDPLDEQLVRYYNAAAREMPIKESVYTMSWEKYLSEDSWIEAPKKLKHLRRVRNLGLGLR